MPTAKNYDFIKSIEGDLAGDIHYSSASVKTDAEAPTEAYKAEKPCRSIYYSFRS